jgi:hypothetical protein
MNMSENIEKQVMTIWASEYAIPSIKRRLAVKKIQLWYSNYNIIKGYFSRTIWRDWYDASWETEYFAYDKCGRLYNVIVIPQETGELFLECGSLSIVPIDVILQDSEAIYYKIDCNLQVQKPILPVPGLNITIEDIKNTNI